MERNGLANALAARVEAHLELRREDSTADDVRRFDRAGEVFEEQLRAVVRDEIERALSEQKTR